MQSTWSDTINDRALATSLLLLAAALAGCEQRLADPVEPDSVEWTGFRSAALGVSFRYPTVWSAAEGDDGVVLQDAHATAARLTLLERRAAERRGLWGRTPVVRVDTIGGLTFEFYRYDHFDGPTYVPTLAFVARHRGVELGIEFRTRRAEPDETQRRILASLRLD